tara:strand:- start:146 stop:952 length:807 start_codon:yes stop_codon:yes gene_type:complete
MKIDSILCHRLFGYGIPYRVKCDKTVGFSVVETSAEQEAKVLASTLSNLQREAVLEGEMDPLWAYSMPFGRCGIEGLPREYIQVHFSQEAYVDVLRGEGVATRAVSNGEVVAIEPRTVVRLRARPAKGGRVLVAFQTQDHTPLHGNAGPFVIEGPAPEDWRERLLYCYAAFEETSAMMSQERKVVLDRFFDAMAVRIADVAEVHSLRESARTVGSYVTHDEDLFFDRQRVLLSETTMARVARADEEVFRFPGMFGAVAPLFSLIKQTR